MFGKRRYEECRYIFIEGKENNFVLKGLFLVYEGSDACGMSKDVNFTHASDTTRDEPSDNCILTFNAYMLKR